MYKLSPTELKKLCQKYGLTPSKKYGQNYLISDGPINKIISAGELTKDDTVIEVGPGFGILTLALSPLVKHVIAYEIERKLQPYWLAKQKEFPNVEIVWGNALDKIKNEKLKIKNFKVMANLPYQITSHALRTFLEMENKPERIIVMVQKEVADRICAKPGEMSLLAVSVQLYAQPIIFFEVNRENFWPRPAVDSAVIRIGRIKTQKEAAGWLGAVKEEEFWRLVRIGFAAKRKQLQNNLAAGLKVPSLVARGWLILAHLAPTVRAQELSLVDWLRLAKISKIHSK